MRLWNQEEILEERVKTERRQRLLMANPEDLPFLDLLRVIYIHALEKNINGYQAASTPDEASIRQDRTGAQT